MTPSPTRPAPSTASGTILVSAPPNPLVNTHWLTRLLLQRTGGGASYGQGNTTDWPLDGGNLELGLHHPWTYVYVNLGLGGNTTNFNITLTPDLWNTTGSGTLCVDKLNVPSGIADGTLASLQVVTAGAGGQALYNCADIRFSKAAKRGNCTNQGVTLVAVKGTASNSTSGTPTSSGGSTNETGSKKSAAVAGVARDGVLTTMAGAAALLAFSMSL